MSRSKWIRGSGYFNSRVHKVMMSEDEFRALFDNEPWAGEQILQARYEQYCVSWRSYHESSS